MNYIVSTVYYYFVGGELKDVLIRMKRHAEVENDAKRIQLEIDQLKEDSMDLIERYPGKDAENVSRKRASLVEDWDGLKKALVRRRNELESLATTHRWLNNAKELQKWGDHSLANMTGILRVLSSYRRDPNFSES